MTPWIGLGRLGCLDGVLDVVVPPDDSPCDGWGKMTAGHIRDTAATVAVLAFFASTWFGWAQESPPKAWRLPLALASVVSVLLAVLGGVLTWQRWVRGSVFDQLGTARAFGIVVGVEFVIAGVGAIVLIRCRRRQFTAVWIALVVGVHFVPLASLLDYPLLYAAAAGVVAVAVAAVPVARSRKLPLSLVTGTGTGSVLLAVALVSLAAVFH